MWGGGRVYGLRRREWWGTGPDPFRTKITQVVSTFKLGVNVQKKQLMYYLESEIINIFHLVTSYARPTSQYVVNSGDPSARGNECLVSTNTFCIPSSRSRNL